MGDALVITNRQPHNRVKLKLILGYLGSEWFFSRKRNALLSSSEGVARSCETWCYNMMQKWDVKCQLLVQCSACSECNGDEGENTGQVAGAADAQLGLEGSQMAARADASERQAVASDYAGSVMASVGGGDDVRPWAESSWSWTNPGSFTERYANGQSPKENIMREGIPRKRAASEHLALALLGSVEGLESEHATLLRNRAELGNDMQTAESHFR